MEENENINSERKGKERENFSSCVKEEENGSTTKEGEGRKKSLQQSSRRVDRCCGTNGVEDGQEGLTTASCKVIICKK